MSRELFVAALVQAVLLPPGLSVTLLVVGILLPDGGTQSLCLAAGIATLYVSSLPLTSSWLRGKLEIYPPVEVAQSTADAIVVLGADRYIGAPEYDGDTLSGLGLERLRYAARLQKQTGLPILVSGGSVLGEKTPEAEIMRDMLTREFGALVRWEEGASRNTFENAYHASEMLKDAGVGEILLITHAWHMPRALEAFKRAGLKVTPAPTGFFHPGNSAAGPLAWLPSASALLRTQLALHEMLGRLWYHFRYY